MGNKASDESLGLRVCPVEPRCAKEKVSSSQSERQVCDPDLIIHTLYCGPLVDRQDMLREVRPRPSEMSSLLGMTGRDVEPKKAPV